MYIERDPNYDLLYIGLRDDLKKGEVSETTEVSPGTYLDFDSDGKLVGIEIVNTQSVLGRSASELRLNGELIGVKEAAILARKDRANFLRDMASRTDFPDPVARVASGQLWFSRDIKRYLGIPEADSEVAEPHERTSSHKKQPSRLPYTGWEGRKEKSRKSYRYEDHEQYEDHEVMDTSESAPEEARAVDDKDHESFRSGQDASTDQESA